MPETAAPPKPAAEAKKATPTERVVLMCILASAGEMTELLGGHEGGDLLPETVEGARELWVPIGTGSGSKAKVIQEVTKGAHGAFRAPSLRTWNGGIENAEEVVPEQRKPVKRHFE